MNENVFKTAPAVFAVGNDYQILVPVKCETLMWVKVGDMCFYDHANGTMRSATDIHRMTVPMEILDREKQYSIHYRVIIDRKPYFPETEEEREEIFDFSPVVGSDAKGFLIADAHNNVLATVCSAKKFEEKYGEIDFLILAGDIPDHSGRVENFLTIFKIAEGVTGGKKPILYAKGNHDMRGICAEKMEQYTPVSKTGTTYFTFRIGDIWGISLDCGEDKEDTSLEYGHTICCHQLRLEETEFIKAVIKNADGEYNAEGVKRRIIVVHNPFTSLSTDPFNIEHDIFTEWGRLLKEMSPDIMICGHFHKIAVSDVGSESDDLGQPCRVVIGALPFWDKEKHRHHVGTGFIFSEDGINQIFIDDLGKEYTV